MKRLVVKGDIAYTPDKDYIITIKDGYIIVEDGLIKEVTKEKPSLEDCEFSDYSGKLIMPGFSDLHLHAPQYSYVGLGMDKELLDWLETYTFPEEAKFCDIEYAKNVYDIFSCDVLNSSTTRIVCFATIHKDSTKYLMDRLDKMGIKGYVGKLTMDRNSNPKLTETNSDLAIKSEREFIIETKDAYQNIKPIITPRFTPSVSDETMKGLGELAKEFDIRTQSHLSENPSEIEWVKELAPWSSCYADTYYKAGLLGDLNKPTVMAHCVYSLNSSEEMKLIKDNNVYIAHCPQSNINVASGIAPIREYLDMNINLGLGSDVAGGSSLDIRRAIVDAIGVSKLRWRIVDSNSKPLTVTEGLYLATKGGGSYFGKVGSFEPEYEFDAVVYDDEFLLPPCNRSIEDRVARLIYLTQNGAIVSKYIKGRKVL